MKYNPFPGCCGAGILSGMCQPENHETYNGSRLPTAEEIKKLTDHIFNTNRIGILFCILSNNPDYGHEHDLKETLLSLGWKKNRTEVMNSRYPNSVDRRLQTFFLVNPQAEVKKKAI